MIREQLVRQITGSVLWTQCMEKLIKIGCNNFIEFGSGKVLSGLAKKIDSEALTTFNIESIEDFKNFLTDGIALLENFHLIERVNGGHDLVRKLEQFFA